MSTKELKQFIHQGIENIDDEAFLEAVYDMVHRKYETEKEPNLSAQQLKRIKDANSNIEKGNFLTQKQVDDLVQEWLKRD